MRPFRFSAQTALQFRRRQHEQALVTQSDAERVLAAATVAVDVAAGVVRNADARIAQAMGSSVDQLPWHLAWRSRCIGEREQLETRRRQRLMEAECARERATQAYRRVRALERLRERALLAWTQLSELEERKTMDALAGSQFVRRKDEYDECNVGGHHAAAGRQHGDHHD